MVYDEQALWEMGVYDVRGGAKAGRQTAQTIQQFSNITIIPPEAKRTNQS